MNRFLALCNKFIKLSEIKRTNLISRSSRNIWHVSTQELTKLYRTVILKLKTENRFG